MIIMDNDCIALFFIKNELIALYTFTQHVMMMMMMKMMMMMMMMYTCKDAVTPCYCSTDARCHR